MGQEPDNLDGVKPATPAQRKSDCDGMESRFAGLCKSSLRMDESAIEEAMTLFKACKPTIGKNMLAIGTGSADELERHLSAFVIYCVAKLGKEKPDSEGRLSLSRILKTVKLSVTDFFREVPQLMLKSAYILSYRYGSDWERRLEVTEVQANAVHLRVLSNYYKRTYEEFFCLQVQVMARRALMLAMLGSFLNIIGLDGCSSWHCVSTHSVDSETLLLLPMD